MSQVLLTIGTSKGLFLARSTDDRISWQVSGPQFAMHAVAAIGIDTRRATPRLLAGASSAHWGPAVSHSDDLGATWVEPEEASIAFPEDAGASLAQVWQLRPAPSDQPDVVYAGAEPSSLWRSTDGGVSFDLVRALWDHPHRPDWHPGAGGQCLHTVIPHPRDPDSLMVAMSTGGVYRTTDGGASWNASNRGIKAQFMPDPEPEFGQCVHKVAMHPANPDRYFLQHHGGVYRSDDAGTTWTRIDAALPADFGFPVVVHPHRPDTAYVVPLVADLHRMPPGDLLRVWRTDDAGETWTELSEGLPAAPSYATVLRDALCTDDADPAGVYVGTRSGEVYASRDDGDSWSMVAAHLPDVLCVRAAVVG
jgi:photosystem II stability/assembly factor-like uncharacterized protein